MYWGNFSTRKSRIGEIQNKTKSCVVLCFVCVTPFQGLLLRLGGLLAVLLVEDLDEQVEEYDDDDMELLIHL